MLTSDKVNSVLEEINKDEQDEKVKKSTAESKEGDIKSCGESNHNKCEQSLTVKEDVPLNELDQEEGQPRHKFEKSFPTSKSLDNSEQTSKKSIDVPKKVASDVTIVAIQDSGIIIVSDDEVIGSSSSDQDDTAHVAVCDGALNQNLKESPSTTKSIDHQKRIEDNHNKVTDCFASLSTTSSTATTESKIESGEVEGANRSTIEENKIVNVADNQQHYEKLTIQKSMKIDDLLESTSAKADCHTEKMVVLHSQQILDKTNEVVEPKTFDNGKVKQSVGGDGGSTKQHCQTKELIDNNNNNINTCDECCRKIMHYSNTGEKDGNNSSGTSPRFKLKDLVDRSVAKVEQAITGTILDIEEFNKSNAKSRVRRVRRLSTFNNKSHKTRHRRALGGNRKSYNINDTSDDGLKSFEDHSMDSSILKVASTCLSSSQVTNDTSDDGAKSFRDHSMDSSILKVASTRVSSSQVTYSVDNLLEDATSSQLAR